MNAVVKATPTASIAITSKKALKFVVDTGPNEKKLEDLGLSREFQRETKPRMLEIDLSTGLPALPGVKPESFRMLDITGPLIAIGAIASGDNEFRMLAVCTQANTTYLVQIGKKVFHFVYDVTSTNGHAALESLFTECLNRGPRGYENNNTMIPEFWDKLLTLLYPEGGKLEFGLYSRDKEFVLSRLYFTPGAKDHTLSVGGFCYNLSFGVFPREAISRGINKWKDEQKKQGKDNGGRVSLASLVVSKDHFQKQSNKDKPKRPVIAPVITGKSWEDLVKVHERTPAEIAGDKKRAEAVAAKKAAQAKPAKAEAKPAKGKK